MSDKCSSERFLSHCGNAHVRLLISFGKRGETLLRQKRNLGAFEEVQLLLVLACLFVGCCFFSLEILNNSKTPEGRFLRFTERQRLFSQSNVVDSV